MKIAIDILHEKIRVKANQRAADRRQAEGFENEAQKARAREETCNQEIETLQKAVTQLGGPRLLVPNDGFPTGEDGFY